MAEDFTPNDVCIFQSPNPQFAIDLIEGWTCKFPGETGVMAGPVDLFRVQRAFWAFEKIVGVHRSGGAGHGCP
jgi:hypothetical protein